jgi:1-acyl-sn-glycerol-3-phosphate acyltransferase
MHQRCSETVRSLPPRTARRILLPVSALLLIVVGTFLSLLSLVGILAAPLTPRRRALRLSAFALSYCAIEIATMAAAGLVWLRRVIPGFGLTSQEEWIVANERLLIWALGKVLSAGRRWLGFTVVVADSSDTTALAGSDPVLVLARHGGPGDSFALVHLLLTRYHRRVHIILKDTLQLDPLIDLLLNRLGCCFLPSGSGDRPELTEQLGDMALALGTREVLLLFPEGANWTPHRRRRAIDRLRRDKKLEAARVAELMDNVLPPRPAGVLACLDARPDLLVVVVAHAGLDKVISAREAWNLLPVKTPMHVRAWPTADVPQDREARLPWLTLEWAVVDEWIDAYHAGAPPFAG